MKGRGRVDSDNYDALAKRVGSLEAWRAERDIAAAVQAEHMKHFDRRFDEIDTKVQVGFSKLDGLISRIVWLIITALVGAVMAFILGGGLTGAGG